MSQNDEFNIGASKAKYSITPVESTPRAYKINFDGRKIGDYIALSGVNAEKRLEALSNVLNNVKMVKDPCNGGTSFVIERHKECEDMGQALFDSCQGVIHFNVLDKIGNSRPVGKLSCIDRDFFEKLTGKKCQLLKAYCDVISQTTQDYRDPFYLNALEATTSVKTSTPPQARV